jgi:hypothetical protein
MKFEPCLFIHLLLRQSLSAANRTLSLMQVRRRWQRLSSASARDKVG